MKPTFLPYLAVTLSAILWLGGCSQEDVASESQSTRPAEDLAKKTESTAISHQRLRANQADYAELRWKPQYKLYADEVEKLTPADIVGPDGIIYPDFRYAGIPGGIPDVPVVAKLSEFGGDGQDELNDLPAIQAAIAEIVKQGGGALEFGPGTFYLDAPLLIAADNVVLRGAGQEATTLVYRHFPEEGTIEWIYPEDVSTPLTANDFLRVHAHPFGLMEFRIEANGKELFTLGPSRDGTHRYWLSIPLHAFWKHFPEGDVPISVYARWYDGKEQTLERTIRIDRSVKYQAGKVRIPNNDAGILFLGDRHSARRSRWPLAADALRGQSEIVFAKVPSLQAGDGLKIVAPPSQAFIQAVASARKDIPRNQIVEVVSVEGKTVKLNQPLRQDFLLTEKCYGEPYYPIRNCGVEDLTYTQPRMLYANGISFQLPWACWVRDVTIKSPGRNPLQVSGKFSEVRNVKLSEAWYRGGGGTGYFAFSSAHDCLAENIDARNLRHAPNIQWGATGNVIRNSVFYSSDAQYHMGFALENLYENCIVDAKRGTGSYGYGLFVQKPEVSIHGPGGGPRNVVYNCDFKSPVAGVFLGGSNENWIILYNRFVVEKGPGMILRDHNFDHIILGNVLDLKQSGQPAIKFEGKGHPGVEIIDNLIVGSTQLATGNSGPLLLSGNQFIEKSTETPERPTPVVPSIYEWQLKHLPLSK